MHYLSLYRAHTTPALAHGIHDAATKIGLRGQRRKIKPQANNRLRQLGAQPPKSLDAIAYYREARV